MRNLINKFKNWYAHEERVWDTDEFMTEHEAVAYSKAQGFPLTLSRLRASRMAIPTCAGPRFEKIGFYVFYTPRLLDEFIFALKPHVIDPTKRMRG